VSRSAGSIIVVGLVLLIIYLIYTGSYVLTELVFALIIGFLTAYIFGYDLVENIGLINLKRLVYAIMYMFKYFTVIEAKAHYMVIKSILSPKPELKPSIVRIPYRVESDYSIVSIANSITNTPGTVVVDVDEENKYFYVHWLFTTTTEDEEARKKVSKEFEDWMLKIFEKRSGG